MEEGLASAQFQIFQSVWFLDPHRLGQRRMERERVW